MPEKITTEVTVLEMAALNKMRSIKFGKVTIGIVNSDVANITVESQHKAGDLVDDLIDSTVRQIPRVTPELEKYADKTMKHLT